MTDKSQPVTMEMFDEAILPRIEEIFENKLKKYSNDVVGFKDEVMGEIKALRDEVLVTSHHYEKTNKRVDLIDKHLEIDTSTVF